VVGVDALQDAIDLGFVIFAPGLEAKGQVTQHGDAVGPRRGDRFEVSGLEEAGQLRGSLELLDPAFVALLQHVQTVRPAT